MNVHNFMSVCLHVCTAGDMLVCLSVCHSQLSPCQALRGRDNWGGGSAVHVVLVQGDGQDEGRRSSVGCGGARGFRHVGTSLPLTAGWQRLEQLQPIN